MIDSDTAPSAALNAVLSAFTAAVDAFLAFDLAGDSPAELVAFASAWETQQRRCVAIGHHLVAALSSTGAPGEFGYRDPAALLADVLRLTPGEARARVRAAEALGPQRSLAGEPLPARFGAVAQAQEMGAISAAHANVILTALDSLSPAADVLHAEKVQSLLVQHASELDPNRLGAAAARALAHLDPDGRRPSDADQQRRRELRVSPATDGSGLIQGRLTPELLAVLQTVLDPLSAPAPADDGVPDPRSAGQRRHDGLLDLCQRVLRDGNLPASGGVPTTLVLTMPAIDFQARTGFAMTAHGGLIKADDVVRLADQADVYLLQLNASGGVLDYGRTRRCATPSQRVVLWGRDHGCTFPGCTVAAPWTQAHHFVEWLGHGVTSTENLGLLCGHHHRNFEKMGWTGVMRDGVPWWIPPAHLDPQQKPRQNLYWKTPAIRR